LLLNSTQIIGNLSYRHLFPVILMFYLFLQAVPLPFELVEFLSPMRAERVRMVNEFAGTEQYFITLSENGIGGIFRAIFILALIIYYYSLKILISADDHAYYQLFYCIVLVGVIEAIYGLLQFVNPGIGILWHPLTAGRAAHGTIIYKNQYASLLNMIWPLAVGGTAMFFIGRQSRRAERDRGQRTKDIIQKISKTKPQAIFLASVAIMIMLAVMFSLSRGGILSMVFVGFCMILLLPFSIKSKLLTFLIFSLLIGGYGAMMGLDTIITRFDSIGASKGVRLDIYFSSLPMLFDHWLTGIGLGSYTLLSPIYLKGFPAHYHFDRVHSEYLELLIELGGPMALLLFGWIIVGIWNLISRTFTVRSPKDSKKSKLILAIASLCGIIGFLVHGFIDFGWRLPANVFFALTLVAFCVTGLESLERAAIDSGTQRAELKDLKTLE